MKFFFKRIIPLFLVLVTLVFVCATSFAVVLPDHDTTVNFWAWAQGDTRVGFSSYLGSVFNADPGCSVSSDGNHHWVLVGDPTVSLISNAFLVECSYCGQNYKQYKNGEEGSLTSSDLSAAYDDYTSTLPVSTVTSNGSLIWQVQLSDVEAVRGSLLISFGNSGINFPFPLPSTKEDFTITAINSYQYCITYSGSRYSTGLIQPYISTEYYVPISGSYTPLCDENDFFVYVVGTYIDSQYPAVSSETYTYISKSTLTKHIEAGKYPYFSSNFFGQGISLVGRLTYLNAVVTLPCFEIIPDTVLNITSGDTYNNDNRPTSITGGNYGIVGDDNTVTTVHGDIVNEGDSTYWNPVTNTTSTVTDWTYDYSDRSYTLSLDTGDTSTVTYGDEYISITENNVDASTGDTIVNNYTVYYMVEAPATEDPDPSPSPSSPGSGEAHTHDWQLTATTEPTCILSGTNTFTCSCGETKTETVPALGHDWQVKQQVTTEYGPDGELLTSGYTIYECSRCGEQYRDDDGTGPPGGSSSNDDGSLLDKLGDLLGAGIGGLIRLIGHVLGGILDALISVLDLAVDKLGDVVDLVFSMFAEIPAMFGGFLDFLSAVFPFFPPEIMLLLTFGIAVVVAIGIIKALRR